MTRCNNPVAPLQQTSCSPTTPEFCSYLSVLQPCNRSVAAQQQVSCSSTTGQLQLNNRSVACCIRCNRSVVACPRYSYVVYNYIMISRNNNIINNIYKYLFKTFFKYNIFGFEGIKYKNF